METKTNQQLLKEAAAEVKAIAKEALTSAEKTKELVVRIIWMETRLAKDGASNTLAGKKVAAAAEEAMSTAGWAAAAAAEAIGIYYNLADTNYWDGYEPAEMEKIINEQLTDAKRSRRIADCRYLAAAGYEHTAQWWYDATTRQPQGWHSKIETKLGYTINPTAISPDGI